MIGMATECRGDLSEVIAYEVRVLPDDDDGNWPTVLVADRGR